MGVSKTICGGACREKRWWWCTSFDKSKAGAKFAFHSHLACNHWNDQCSVATWCNLSSPGCYILWAGSGLLLEGFLSFWPHPKTYICVRTYKLKRNKGPKEVMRRGSCTVNKRELCIAKLTPWGRHLSPVAALNSLKTFNWWWLFCLALSSSEARRQSLNVRGCQPQG